MERYGVSGTYHNIFSVAKALQQSGFRILNVITWAKTNPPPNISCRFFTYSTEFVINDGRMASACHRSLGKVLRKASHAKAIESIGTDNSRINRT